MFMSYSSIKSMFFCQGHVLEIWPCFMSGDTFLYQGHVLVSNQFFKSKGCFN
jgi:hypothetical protein